MQSAPFLATALPSMLVSELLRGTGVDRGQGLWEAGPTRLSSLNKAFVMQSGCMFLLILWNSDGPHSSVTPGSLWRTEARVRCTVETDKRFQKRVFCTLPALHQRGSLPVAVVWGRFREHSREDRTLQPTIYAASQPSPCSAATGESGCRWYPSSAGPCESLPATDCWEVSVSGWIHPWCRNNDAGKKRFTLDAFTYQPRMHPVYIPLVMLISPEAWLKAEAFEYHTMIFYQVYFQ